MAKNAGLSERVRGGERRGRGTHFLHNRKCCTARMATNGILLYAMKKLPNDGEWAASGPDTKSLNRTEKRSGQ